MNWLLAEPLLVQLYTTVLFFICALFSAALKSESFSLRSSPEWPWVLIIRQPNISGIYLTRLSRFTPGVLPPDDPLTGFVCFQHSTLFSWFLLRPNRLLFATDFLSPNNMIWYSPACKLSSLSIKLGMIGLMPVAALVILQYIVHTF